MWVDDDDWVVVDYPCSILVEANLYNELRIHRLFHGKRPHMYQQLMIDLPRMVVFNAHGQRARTIVELEHVPERMLPLATQATTATLLQRAYATLQPPADCFICEVPYAIRHRVPHIVRFMCFQKQWFAYHQKCMRVVKLDQRHGDVCTVQYIQLTLVVDDLNEIGSLELVKTTHLPKLDYNESNGS